MRVKFDEERERLRVRRRRELEQGIAKECLQLFHGTAQAAQSIVEQGFKKELAGKTRFSLWERGVLCRQG